jgi:hypothetical protein
MLCDCRYLFPWLAWTGLDYTMSGSYFHAGRCTAREFRLHVTASKGGGIMPVFGFECGKVTLDTMLANVVLRGSIIPRSSLVFLLLK